MLGAATENALSPNFRRRTYAMLFVANQASESGRKIKFMTKPLIYTDIDIFGLYVGLFVENNNMKLLPFLTNLNSYFPIKSGTLEEFRLV